jgi:PncC family amidohydrolase
MPKTVAIAESLTGGMVGSEVVSRSGASKYFLGGLIAYTLEAKVEKLLVDRKLAEACGCVSAEVAEQMAVGVSRLFKSDVGVSTTGFAEPHSEEPQHAFVGLYDSPTGVKIVRHVSVDTDAGSPASRNDFRRRVTNLALAMLHEYASVPV